jgi:hypothetical protein
MADARRLLLKQFKDNEIVTRESVNRIAKLHSSVIKYLLGQIADLQRGKGWTLRISPDEAFIAAYPAVIKRSNEIIDKEAEQCVYVFCMPIFNPQVH